MTIRKALQIEGDLHKRLKVRAAQEGRTVKEVTEEALKWYLTKEINRGRKS